MNQHVRIICQIVLWFYLWPYRSKKMPLSLYCSSWVIDSSNQHNHYINRHDFPVLASHAGVERWRNVILMASSRTDREQRRRDNFNNVVGQPVVCDDAIVHLEFSNSTRVDDLDDGGGTGGENGGGGTIGLSRRTLLTTTSAWATSQTLITSWFAPGNEDSSAPLVRPACAQESWSSLSSSSLASYSTSSPSPLYYMIRPRFRNATSTTMTNTVKNQAVALQDLSRERALLKLLPIRNDRKFVFRALQGRLEGISFALSTAATTATTATASDSVTSSSSSSNSTIASATPTTAAAAAAAASTAIMWSRIRSSMTETIAFLDNQRDQLSPVFNQEDSTSLAIRKGEQGELRIERLRTLLVELRDVCAAAAQAEAPQQPQTLLDKKGRKEKEDEDEETDLERSSDPTKSDTSPTTRPSSSFFVETVRRKQQEALLALAEVGELLVATFPYDVPAEGKFSYLPRLLGRARVTFSFRRETQGRNLFDFNKNSNGNNNNKGGFLGNITILADGFLAPITAGNFVDLSFRNFYTGLPIKSIKKRLLQKSTTTTTTTIMTSTSASREEVAEVSATTSSSSSSLPSSFGFVETLDVPVLGSFREGFFDPLTAKLRRIPLELIRVEKASSVPSLSYSLQGENSGGLAFLDLSTKLTQDLEYLTTTTTSSSIMDITGDMLDLEPPRPTRAKSTTSTSSTSKPLFSFNDIPGLVALNHPDKYPNGGSSEFFCLQSADSM